MGSGRITLERPEACREIRRGRSPRRVLLLHDLAGGPGEFDLLADELAHGGFEVLAPLLSGHGLADATPSTSARAEGWIEDAERGLAAIACDEKSVAVIGSGLGATLGLYLAGVHDLLRLVVLEPFEGLGLGVIGVTLDAWSGRALSRQSLGLDRLDGDLPVPGYAEVPPRLVLAANALWGLARRGFSRIRCPVQVIRRIDPPASGQAAPVLPAVDPLSDRLPNTAPTMPTRVVSGWHCLALDRPAITLREPLVRMLVSVWPRR